MALGVGQQHYDAQNVGDIMTRPPRPNPKTTIFFPSSVVSSFGDEST